MAPFYSTSPSLAGDAKSSAAAERPAAHPTRLGHPAPSLPSPALQEGSAAGSRAAPFAALREDPLGSSTHVLPLFRAHTAREFLSAARAHERARDSHKRQLSPMLTWQVTHAAVLRSERGISASVCWAKALAHTQVSAEAGEKWCWKKSDP